MFRSRTTQLSVLLTLGATLALSACGEDGRVLNPLQPLLPEAPKDAVSRIDLSTHTGAGAYSVEAVAVHPDSGNLFALFPGQGILELDDQGELVDAIPYGEETGLVDRAYLDLDILPSGRFVLAAFDEAMSYDPETGTLESYFCLVPGFMQIIMENKAIGIDPDSQEIFAAPAYFDYSEGPTDTPTEAFHAQYATDGTLMDQADVTHSGVIAEGMAVEPNTGDLLVVDADQLHRFNQAGELLSSTPLVGIEDASGLTLDASGERVLVTDRADMEVRAFDLE